MKRLPVGLLENVCLVFLSVVATMLCPMSSVSAKPVENLHVDVLVIGGGGGGLMAGTAAKAALGDGSVLVVEKNPVTGGNSFNFSSPIRPPGSGETMPLMPGEEIEAGNSGSMEDIQFEKMIDHTHWRLDARLVRRLIAVSLETTEWLWGLLPEEEKKRITTAAESLQNTEPYPVAMTRLCRNLGVEILVSTKATKLLTDENGAVAGALAEGESKNYRISAGAVVIATGGFIGNEALMKKYYHPYDEDLYEKINIIGQKHTGDGILMAAEAGASLDATISFETSMKPVYWEVSDIDALRTFLTIPINGEHVWLDAKGRRIADESDPDSLNILRTVLNRVYYIVFDENVKAHIPNKKSVMVGGPPGMGAPSYEGLDEQIGRQIDKGYAVKADTLDELARFIGCAPDTLKATIGEYNTFCETGYDALFLKPAESLVPLSTPPYYAVRNKLAILLTHGPLRVDTEMAVVDKNHDPIPGLYAAGADVGGWENDTYADVPRHSSGWTMASGRLAGENAAKYSEALKHK